MNAGSPERNYAIDWLRVFAMFTVFLFHCARFFDRDDWHVKNPQSDTIITFIVLFLVQWIMPLFFILSGISSYYSLGFRKAGTYVRGRFKRLMIPYLFYLRVCHIDRTPLAAHRSKTKKYRSGRGISHHNHSVGSSHIKRVPRIWQRILFFHDNHTRI